MTAIAMANHSCYPAVKLNLNGHSVIKFSFSPTDAYARLKIDNNGNVYESEDTGSAFWSQIDSATGDWVRPTTAAPGNYEVRFTNETVTPDFSTKATGVWHPLDTGDFIIYMSELGIGTSSTDLDIEIRNGSSGSADVSASYTITASVEFL